MAAKLNPPPPRTVLARHGMAVLFVGGALVLTVWIQQVSARAHFILFVPAVIIEDALHVSGTQAADRGIQLSSALPSDPVIVAADPTRVRQIVSNLLSNAVKFTPDGGRITLILEQNRSEVSFRVRDTGRGIAADQIPHIFNLFHKADAGGPGLGVGLAVVKGLAEMHGGSVAARSDGPGHGSEFIVTLPTQLQTSVA